MRSDDETTATPSAGKVLVAGVSGTLGRAIARRLVDAGWDVSGVSRGPGEFGTTLDLRQAIPGVALRHGDLSDRSVAASVCAEVSAIVFAAGASGVASSIDDVAGNLVGNALPWLNLLESCPSRTHLVLLSSQLVYGEARSKPFGENDRLVPASPYAIHRVLLEDYGRVLAKQRQLSITVLRLGNVFGDVVDIQAPRTHGVVARMLADMVRTGVARLYGDGNQRLELLHADDLGDTVDLILRHGEAPGRSEIYNVAGHSMTVHAIAESLREGLGSASITTEAWKPGMQAAVAVDVHLDEARFRARYGWTPARDVRKELNALGRTWRSAVAAPAHGADLQ